ncbi:MAG: hypothetical protein FD161_3089 [Limisphaerales bacterium]|nr:MAG: hypothetical protein FD161_3089 [Limisphaerales bacterium]KAG0508082.1 MAG: hypothetical protein E1N63_2796 [Limisphaerales bacterium]TXT52019.1 MAG: hypothetical protein FD140_1141 [Limisphaerales bacterium]
MTTETLEKEAMKLTPAKRLRLAEKLMNSVDATSRPTGRTKAASLRGATLAETVRRLRPFPDGKSFYDLTKDLCGSVTGGPGDLATNKSHLKDLGKWKR